MGSAKSAFVVVIVATLAGCNVVGLFGKSGSDVKKSNDKELAPKPPIVDIPTRIIEKPTEKCQYKLGEWLKMDPSGAPANIKDAYKIGYKSAFYDDSKPSIHVFDPCDNSWSVVNLDERFRNAGTRSRTDSKDGLWILNSSGLAIYDFSTGVAKFAPPDPLFENLRYQNRIIENNLVVVFPRVEGSSTIFDFGKAKKYNFEEEIWQDLPEGEHPGTRSLSPDFKRSRQFRFSNKVIVWGGKNHADEELNDGFILDLETLEWSPMHLEGSPIGRFDYRGVISNNTFKIWSGARYDSGHVVDVSSELGASYDLKSNEWSPFSGPSDPSRGFNIVDYGDYILDAYFDPDSPGNVFNSNQSGQWEKINANTCPSKEIESELDGIGDDFTSTGYLSVHGSPGAETKICFYSPASNTLTEKGLPPISLNGDLDGYGFVNEYVYILWRHTKADGSFIWLKDHRN